MVRGEQPRMPAKRFWEGPSLLEDLALRPLEELEQIWIRLRTGTVDESIHGLFHRGGMESAAREVFFSSGFPTRNGRIKARPWRGEGGGEAAASPNNGKLLVFWNGSWNQSAIFDLFGCFVERCVCLQLGHVRRPVGPYEAQIATSLRRGSIGGVLASQLPELGEGRIGIQLLQKVPRCLSIGRKNAKDSDPLWLPPFALMLAQVTGDGFFRGLGRGVLHLFVERFVENGRGDVFPCGRCGEVSTSSLSIQPKQRDEMALDTSGQFQLGRIAAAPMDGILEDDGRNSSSSDLYGGPVTLGRTRRADEQ